MDKCDIDEMKLKLEQTSMGLLFNKEQYRVLTSKEEKVSSIFYFELLPHFRRFIKSEIFNKIVMLFKSNCRIQDNICISSIHKKPDHFISCTFIYMYI